jgi:hypothetical protein
MSCLAAEPNESCPSLNSIQDDILSTIKRSMFEDSGDELTNELTE